MAIQKDISLRGCGEGALGSDERGLLGALPRSWLLHWVWGACAGSLMELVYILVADVLAATGHAAPLLEPWSCVLHPWPLEGPSLQHVRSEPGKGSLYGWAPRPWDQWALGGASSLSCWLLSQTAISVNPDFSVSSEALMPRLSLGSVCLHGGSFSEQGWAKVQQGQLFLPARGLAGWGTHRTRE